MKEMYTLETESSVPSKYDSKDNIPSKYNNNYDNNMVYKSMNDGGIKY